MLAEQHFSNRSNYPKVSDTATPIDDIEWFAKNKGITNLDDPSVKVKSIIDGANKSELARQEARKAREAAAQDAFLDAMFNLDSGTAEYRQKNERKKLKVKKAIKVAKAAKAKPKAKAKTSAVKKPKKPYYHKPGRATPNLQLVAKARRAPMVEELKAGKKIPMQPKQSVKGELDLYQQQRKDFKEISKETGMNIVRVNQINGNESYFVADNFARHAIPEKVSGNLDGKDRVALIKAVCSGEVLLASDLIKGTRCGVSSMSILARKHSFDIYTIFIGRHVEGWVLIEDGATEKLAQAKNSEIDDQEDTLSVSARQ